ncbi:tetratricopeptide repeat protein [Candidatus Peregrinibacteria bacterium]|nr:tetratricopeptide repeat protein [Candidatus Peregrinibacteria bacterium]
MRLAKLFIIGFSALLLMGCNSYKVEVNLEKTKMQEIENRIKDLKVAIGEFAPEENGAEIPWVEIIDLSRAYEQLGELGKAIDVYEDVVTDGYKTKAILNNLGKLYEKTEQYDKAIEMYQRINDEYFDHDYLYDITWAYIHAGDRKNAEKYFNAWQLEFSKTDKQTQQAIKKLREAEKTAK